MVFNFIIEKICLCRDIKNLVSDTKILTLYFKGIKIEYYNKVINKIAATLRIQFNSSILPLVLVILSINLISIIKKEFKRQIKSRMIGAGALSTLSTIFKSET